MSRRREKTPLLVEEDNEIKEKTCSGKVVTGAVLSSIATLFLCTAAFLAYYFMAGSTPLPSNPTCTGNGVFYLETKVCECHNCFVGPNCEFEVENCMISMSSGDPLLLQQFWTQQLPSLSNIQTPYNYRNPYTFSLSGVMDGRVSNTTFGGVLNQQIRQIHKKFNNYNITDDHYIVFSNGGTQGLHASLSAYFLRYNTSLLFAKSPYYSAYSSLCSYTECKFTNDTGLTDLDNLVEFVTHPNNPDGFLREKFYEANPNVIYDLVYYWPHLYPVPITPRDGAVAVFSLTKFCGLAGTRFGWMIFQDRALANLAANYVSFQEFHVSVDAAYRTYNTLNFMLSSGGDSLVSTVKNQLASRWSQLLEILNDPQYNLPFTPVGNPNTWYLWLQCKNTGSRDCNSVLRDYGIIGRDGSSFGTPGYVRLSLTIPDSNFQRVLSYLKTGIKSFAKTAAVGEPESLYESWA